MRNLIRHKKGQIRVIEAFFAAVLMLTSLTLIPTVQKSLSANSSSDLSSKALATLVSLDREGQLAVLVDQRNWTAINSLLETVIPAALWFNLTVFDQNMVPLNTFPISNGGVVSSHIDAADYIAASTSRTYAVYTLRLQLAGVG